MALPIDIALEMFSWMDITRNLLTLILYTVFALYASKKMNEDEMWVGQRFAHVASLFISLWVSSMIVAPFIIMSFLYPALAFEIGAEIIGYSLGAVILSIIAVLMFELLQYKGLFQKK